jgi:hypothetical protein
MQKIFDKWAALAVCKVKIFTFANIFTVLCAKRNKLLAVKHYSNRGVEAFQLEMICVSNLIPLYTLIRWGG